MSLNYCSMSEKNKTDQATHSLSYARTHTQPFVENSRMLGSDSLRSTDSGLLLNILLERFPASLNGTESSLPVQAVLQLHSARCPPPPPSV